MDVDGLPSHASYVESRRYDSVAPFVDISSSALYPIQQAYIWRRQVGPTDPVRLDQEHLTEYSLGSISVHHGVFKPKNKFVRGMLSFRTQARHGSGRFSDAMPTLVLPKQRKWRLISLRGCWGWMTWNVCLSSLGPVYCSILYLMVVSVSKERMSCQSPRPRSARCQML